MVDGLFSIYAACVRAGGRGGGGGGAHTTDESVCNDAWGASPRLEVSALLLLRVYEYTHDVCGNRVHS